MGAALLAIRQRVRRGLSRRVAIACRCLTTVGITPACIALAWTLIAAPATASALVTGALADRIADVLAIVVIVVVPIAGIYLFWMLHILPEKVAEKRNHPQKDAIRALCLLSLIFGGMLWPIAWVWAYTRQTSNKLAYGTEKSAEDEARAAAAEEQIHEDRDRTLHAQIDRLRDEVDQLTREGTAPAEVESLKRDLARIEDKLISRPGMH